MILPLQEHVLSYSMYLWCRYFFDMYAYLYFFTVYTVVRFLLEERKRAICFTENDQFTSSCTWKSSNQHGYII